MGAAHSTSAGVPHGSHHHEPDAIGAAGARFRQHFQGIAAEISKRGIVIDDLVSGDAGCTDHALIPTAISLTAYGLDQDEAVQVYLYIFRNRASFEKLRAAVDDCARAFVSDAATFETIEQSPFVVASQGPWAPQFEAALRAALEVSAGTGN